jgi:RNA-directed DNA polymerase
LPPTSAPYVRHVDDFALFHDDAAVLAGWWTRIERYLEGRRLRLHPCKILILPCAQPSPFLGLALGPDGQRRLPEDHVARFRGRLRGLRDRWRAGTVTRAEVDERIGAWIAHASHANTFRLRQAIFEGTRYEVLEGISDLGRAFRPQPA